MRTIWFALLIALFGVAKGSGNAGLYGGWPELFGIHFATAENLRFSVGLSPDGGDPTQYGVAFSFDLILSKGEVYAEGEDGTELTYYAGAGATLGLLRRQPEANGHAMLGLELRLREVKNLGFFGELQLGQRVAFNPLSAGPHLGFRLGLALR